MPLVRFIHTSDLHLDTSFSGAGFPSRLGGRKREAIRAVLRRILGDARREAVDFALIAGDLFEHDRVTPDTVEFLKRQFAEADPLPIYIAPGNHDPCVRGSPYRDAAWSGNVHIFRDEDIRSVEPEGTGVRITGFGYNRAQVRERLFRRLAPLPGDRINLLVAHASDVGRIPAGKVVHVPFAVEEIAGKNVRYCALGHYHQQRPVANPIDATQAWYCGIPEGRAWDEEGECGYLLVEIEPDRVHVQARPCNLVPLRTITVVCDAFSTREQILDAVLEHRGTALDPATILRIRLTGAVDPKLDISIPEMEERLSGLALHIRWDNLTEPALDFDAIAGDSTLAGLFARELNRRIANCEGSRRAQLERARLYGVQALLGREVRLR